jgi:hypothetical protein
LYQKDAMGRPSPKGVTFAYDGSEVVVVAFDGTGAHEPRLVPVMRDTTNALRGKSDTESPGFDPHRLASEALEAHTGKPPRWSGLAAGPLSELMRHPELDDRVQVFTFPSEELEALDGPDALKGVSVSGVLEDIARSHAGMPLGMTNAIECLKSVARQARGQGRSPKFVLLSHSSGGRASVKFAEHAKSIVDPTTGKPFAFPLSYTIDPVKEAHEALADGAMELLNKGTEHNANRLRGLLGLAPNKVWPPTIRSAHQPSKLYKVGNVVRHVNVYQQEDTDGLKLDPPLGIHGSPVAGADVNRDLTAAGTTLGAAAHGTITYEPSVQQGFVDEIKKLLPP